jgi:hypothetical protein
MPPSPVVNASVSKSQKPRIPVELSAHSVLLSLNSTGKWSSLRPLPTRAPRRLYLGLSNVKFHLLGHAWYRTSGVRPCLGDVWTETYAGDLDLSVSYDPLVSGRSRSKRKRLT